MEKIDIYVLLLNEGTSVWRPVNAMETPEGFFKILANDHLDFEDEEIEFGPGSTVKCRFENLSGGNCLVAYELVE